MGFSLNAQNYFSNNPQWRQSSSCRWWGDCIEDQEFVYYINGDSIVNNILYKKLYKRGQLDQYWMGPPPYENCDDHYTFNSFHTLLRQDGLKIYIKESGAGDTLLYDFNLNIGDTLPKTWNQHQDSIIVTSIDSILVGNSFRKVFHFEGFEPDFLIEGIGYYGGLLEPFPQDLECSYLLNCYTLSDTTYFPEFGAYCDLTVDIPKNIVTEISSFYPNPCSNLLTVEFKSYTEIDNVVAFNINGLRTGLNTVSSNQRRILLDVKKLKKGIYVIQINFENHTYQRLKIIKI